MGCSQSQSSTSHFKPTLVSTLEQDLPQPEEESHKELNEPGDLEKPEIIEKLPETVVDPAVSAVPETVSLVESGVVDDPDDKERDEEDFSDEEDPDESAVDFITPHVGFVIKTKRVADSSKVFINLFYHDHKDLLGFVLSAPAKWSRDKKGADCEAYDVTVPKQFFLQSAGSDAARKEVCEDSIMLVNDRYKECLSTDYSLPIIKKGYVGDDISAIEIPASQIRAAMKISQK